MRTALALIMLTAGPDAGVVTTVKADLVQWSPVYTEFPLDEVEAPCGTGDVKLVIDPSQPWRGRLTCTGGVQCSPGHALRYEERDGGYIRRGFLICDGRDGGR